MRKVFLKFVAESINCRVNRIAVSEIVLFPRFPTYLGKMQLSIATKFFTKFDNLFVKELLWEIFDNIKRLVLLAQKVKHDLCNFFL